VGVQQGVVEVEPFTLLLPLEQAQQLRICLMQMAATAEPVERVTDPALLAKADKAAMAVALFLFFFLLALRRSQITQAQQHQYREQPWSQAAQVFLQNKLSN
jgi:hypothetical protein